ncbi:unnamed protein product [Phytophthora fragariaefolia]|uniref:Unnamed protein product n=1 Tax=Phytophthora fragariaefolia TaxID=1490495 RepID=A0A9W7D2W1_9STRA|nr:unnamed protein product [Phytophthora fragariaefolia]
MGSRARTSDPATGSTSHGAQASLTDAFMGKRQSRQELGVGGSPLQAPESPTLPDETSSHAQLLSMLHSMTSLCLPSTSKTCNARHDPDPAQPLLGHSCSVGGEDNFVEVQPPEKIRQNWEEWMAYVKRYQPTTHQVISIKEKVSCKTRNSKISASKAAENGNDVVTVPMEWKVYKRTYICTHGWSNKNRSDGVRPKPFGRSAGGPFRFVVQMVQEEDTWLLKVMNNGVYQHNHRVGPQVYKTYSKEYVKDGVKTMVRMNCRRSKIYEYLLEQGESVVQKDVDNLVQMLKASKQDTSDDDACAVQLAEFSSIEGNTVTVDETSRGDTGVVNISSRHVLHYSVVYHNTENLTPVTFLVSFCCRYNYQLCTLMVIDDYGDDQPIQQSLLERNSDRHMSYVLLQRSNPGQVKKIEVVIVDKDLNEIRVLQQYFPHALDRWRIRQRKRLRADTPSETKAQSTMEQHHSVQSPIRNSNQEPFRDKITLTKENDAESEPKDGTKKIPIALNAHVSANG